MTIDHNRLAPEDCPEPWWHQTHRYCPACSWTEPVDHYHQTLTPCYVTDCTKENRVAAQPERELEGVLSEIRAERVHQDEKWGGAEHDDEHRDQDWYEFIDPRIEACAFSKVVSELGRRRYLIEAAAMIVAWIESHDRAAVLDGGDE